MLKPSIKTRCIAENYAAEGERIAEIWDPNTRLGCLVSVRTFNGETIVELYRADPGVVVRVASVDRKAPQ